jgi:hypothetical protein
VATAGFCLSPPAKLRAILIGRRFVKCIGKILRHSEYEATGLEELARNFGFHPVDQTNAGKLAREVGLSRPGDHGLVPDQTKRSHDALAI